ncbi:MAG: hypothetical protein Q4E09_03245 [Eubacteriales bacterium]|nr:hypothetical protein [Eubacteriales bacterium]
MRHLLFELKKIRKNGILITVVVMAVALGIANQFYSRSKLSDDSRHIYSLHQMTNSIDELFFRADPMAGESEKRDMDSGYASTVLSAYLTKVFDKQNGYYFQLVPSRQLFARAFLVSEIESVHLTEEQEADLRYGLYLTNFLESHQLEEESLVNPTAIYLLKRGLTLIFGVIPLTMFFFLAHYFQSEDREKGSAIYNACLPKNAKRSQIARYLALLLVCLLYIFLVIASSLITSILMGLPLGTWDLPNRILGMPGWHLTNVGFLLRAICDFFLRLSLILALAMLISIAISTSTSTGILFSLLFFFWRYATTQLVTLQKQWNPLYFQYLSRFLGERSIATNDNWVVTGYNITPPISLSTLWLPILAITMLLLALTVCLHPVKATCVRLTENTMSARERKLSQGFLSAIYFEWRKLDELLRFRQALITIFAIGFAFSGMLLVKDASSSEVVHWEKQLNALEEDQLANKLEIEEIESKLDAGGKPKERKELKERKQLLTMYLRYIKSRQDEISMKRDAYLAGDSKTFYNSEIKSLNEDFGKLDEYSYAGDSPYVNGDFPSNFSYEVNLERNQLLAQREIPPFLASTEIFTIYDEMKDSLQERERDLLFQTTDHSALGLAYRLNHYYRFDLIIIAIVMVSCGAGYAIEEQKASGLCWMYTLPQSRGSLALRKYIASLVRAAQYMLTLFMPILLLGFLSSGWGRNDFPVLRYLKPIADAQYGTNFAGQYEFFNRGSHMVEMLIMLFAVVLFLMAFSLLLSTFAVKIINLLTGNIFLLLAAYAANLELAAITIQNASSAKVIREISSYLPFVYLDAERIVSGELLARTGNLSLTTERGVWVCLAWSLFFLLLTVLRVNCQRVTVKKDNPKGVL